jgi:thiol-disulfide isomerase/thioredoxin
MVNYFTDSLYVKEIDDTHFRENDITHLKDKSFSIILFYADWCPHCKAFRDTYEQFAKQALFINALAINCETNKKWTLCIKERHEDFIKTYPTIFFYYKSKPIKLFTGTRTVENLLINAMNICMKSNKNCKLRNDIKL